LTKILHTSLISWSFRNFTNLLCSYFEFWRKWSDDF